MSKTILVTGATDGIGLEAARILLTAGHTVLLHGRNEAKLKKVVTELSGIPGGAVDSFIADLTNLGDVDAMAAKIAQQYSSLDVLINNAGVLKSTQTKTTDGLDIRFVVNTLAPYRLMQKLLPIMGASGRVVNISSAAQVPVNLEALKGNFDLEDIEAYAQSKLAITMWSFELAKQAGLPSVIAVNPGSMLASKMVKDGFGVEGRDIFIGANILVKAAIDDAFQKANGLYFDNDAGVFGEPHADAKKSDKCIKLIGVMDELIKGCI
ncbi:SDR family NAD(P)-dependent oxidoreductase [Granulosicoccus sp.]|nr:SDR family NAD(P)-dependent oxidoreductase [Granulosicoccus sp.]MDB4223960.1 SDR family NAD(P)-dependent oxidoreductase [Granulosicoccus sp.]